MKCMESRNDRGVIRRGWRRPGALLAGTGLVLGLLAAGEGRGGAQGPGAADNPLARRGQTTEALRHIWNFDADQAGEEPAGFSASTLGEGPTGRWKVEADPRAPSAPNRLGQDAPCPTPGCLQILLVDKTIYDYPDVTLRFRTVGDGAPAIGGIVFAARDPRNFYAALIDLAAESLEVVRVMNGEVTVLGRERATRKPVDWHTLRAQHNTNLSKDYIEIAFDGKVVFSTWDTNLTAGQIGVASGGSTPMAFDNLFAVQLFSQRPLSPPAAY